MFDQKARHKIPKEVLERAKDLLQESKRNPRSTGYGDAVGDWRMETYHLPDDLVRQSQSWQDNISEWEKYPQAHLGMDRSGEHFVVVYPQRGSSRISSSGMPRKEKNEWKKRVNKPLKSELKRQFSDASFQNTRYRFMASVKQNGEPLDEPEMQFSQDIDEREIAEEVVQSIQDIVNQATHDQKRSHMTRKHRQKRTAQEMTQGEHMRGLLEDPRVVEDIETTQDFFRRVWPDLSEEILQRDGDKKLVDLVEKAQGHLDKLMAAIRDGDTDTAKRYAGWLYSACDKVRDRVGIVRRNRSRRSREPNLEPITFMLCESADVIAQQANTRGGGNVLSSVEGSEDRLKNQLIRLGSQNPELQKHLKPILNKMGGGQWKASIYFGGMSQTEPPRVRKFRSMGAAEEWVRSEFDSPTSPAPYDNAVVEGPGGTYVFEPTGSNGSLEMRKTAQKQASGGGKVTIEDEGNTVYITFESSVLVSDDNRTEANHISAAIENRADEMKSALDNLGKAMTKWSRESDNYSIQGRQLNYGNGIRPRIRMGDGKFLELEHALIVAVEGYKPGFVTKLKNAMRHFTDYTIVNLT